MSNFTNIGDIVLRFKQMQNAELELRFRDIKKDMFMSAVENFPSDKVTSKSLELSINIISDDTHDKKGNTSRNIVKMVFDGTKKVSEEHWQKQRVARTADIKDIINYSINLSTENKIKPFTVKENSIVRFKLRLSYELAEEHPGAKWRVDFTAVKTATLKNIGPIIVNTRDKLFSGATVDNFTKHIDSIQNLLTDYEIELEYIGNNSIFAQEHISTARLVLSSVDSAYTDNIIYQSEIYTIAGFIVEDAHRMSEFKSKGTLKQLLNNPVSLDKLAYREIFPPVGYFVTEKADGIRCAIIAYNNTINIIANRVISITTEKPVHGVTILDSEFLVEKRESGDTSITLLVFDAIAIKDANVTGDGFQERIQHYKNGVNLLNDALKIIKEIKEYPMGLPSIGKVDSVTIKAKNQVKLIAEELQEQFKGVYNQGAYPYEIDGLIITEPSKKYNDTTVYKWKPFDQTTIDFLAVRATPKMKGVKPYDSKDGYELYILFVGIDRKLQQKLNISFIPQYNDLLGDLLNTTTNYFPIQFSPSAAPFAYIYYHKKELPDIHRKIVELGLSADSGSWVFKRIRDDRAISSNYFGNDFRIAELTYSNYLSKFDLKNLWDLHVGYFASEPSAIYAAHKKFNSFVKDTLITNNASNAQLVVDLASGHGQDIFKYQNAGVREVMFVDADADALVELVRRKLQSAMREIRQASKNIRGYRTKFTPKPTRPMLIHTLHADLLTNYKETSDKILAATFKRSNVTAMHFAIHYFCGSADNLHNLIRLFNAVTDVKGLVLITFIDGQKIFDLLGKQKEWEAREDTTTKYKLIKKYTSESLADFGQKIGVLLPFSRGEIYDEYLVNSDRLIKSFEEHGFSLEVTSFFDKHFDAFAQRRKIIHDALTPADKQYISMYRYMTFRKIKDL